MQRTPSHPAIVPDPNRPPVAAPGSAVGLTLGGRVPTIRAMEDDLQALQERIGSPMLDTPRYAELLNEAAKDPVMLEFLHSAVLRTVPASEVMRSWCHVLLKKFWIATTRDPSPAVRTLYTRLTDEVFAAFADRAMDEGDLVTLLEAWQEPSGNHDIQPFLHRLTQSSRQVFEQAMTARLAQFNATASGAR